MESTFQRLNSFYNIFSTIKTAMLGPRVLYYFYDKHPYDNFQREIRKQLKYCMRNHISFIHQGCVYIQHISTNPN